MSDGEPSAGQVADELIAHLRGAGGSELDFVEPPTRLTGGFDTATYAFRLSAESGKLAGPLILRIFGKQAVRQGLREAVFQNALADLGYPVPRVVYRTAGPGIGGRQFNVMERIPGRSMGEEMFERPDGFATIAERLAGVHAQLHDIPAAPVAKAVGAAGMDSSAFSPWQRLDEARRALSNPRLTHLTPLLEWLDANRPAERDDVSVCHGDFHPGNVMVDGEKVTGLIDWPGAAFGDAEHDVAITLTLVETVAAIVYAQLRPHLQQFRAGYVEAYTRRRPLDLDRIGYYEVLRCFVAFVHGSAALTPGVDPALRPREHYPWANREALRAAGERMCEVTRIRPALPGEG